MCSLTFLPVDIVEFQIADRDGNQGDDDRERAEEKLYHTTHAHLNERIETKDEARAPWEENYQSNTIDRDIRSTRDTS